jgi:hypothetical protein
MTATVYSPVGMGPGANDLDDYVETRVYDDGTVVRMSIRRTDDDAYPSGWRYTLHFGALAPSSETLDDGTIRRYDNSHEDTKGHELHTASDPEPTTIEFPVWSHSEIGSGTRFRKPRSKSSERPIPRGDSNDRHPTAASDGTRTAPAPIETRRDGTGF